MGFSHKGAGRHGGMAGPMRLMLGNLLRYSPTIFKAYDPEGWKQRRRFAERRRAEPVVGERFIPLHVVTLVRSVETGETYRWNVRLKKEAVG